MWVSGVGDSGSRRPELIWDGADDNKSATAELEDLVVVSHGGDGEG